MKTEKIREGLYIKKSFDGYRVVYPIKNEDGTLNWFNLLTGGSYWNLVKTMLVLLLILGITYSYYRDTKMCRDLIENPCDHLVNITNFCYNRMYNQMSTPYGVINFTREVIINVKDT